MPLDFRELSCVLAALRYWQWQRHGSTGRRRLTDIRNIEDNDGSIEPLNDDEIDALCERLNCGELR